MRGSTRGKVPESVVIIRKVKHSPIAHGGAWKVAYADFVTAMLALFIVLWLLSSNQEVQKAVGGYFQDPTGAGRLMGSTRGGQGDPLLVDQANMRDLSQRIQKAMEQDVVEFPDLEGHVQITVTNEGLRIELLESERGTFFDTGRSSPTPAGSGILATLGKELGELPNQIVVEGHTDSRPYLNGGPYGNWELSVDRANTARRLMRERGLRDSQVVEVRGFADQQPRLPDKPEDATNRRVTIIVKYTTTGDKPQPVPPPNDGSRSAHGSVEARGQNDG